MVGNRCRLEVEEEGVWGHATNGMGIIGGMNCERVGGVFADRCGQIVNEI
jgi:hypothetical protein